MLQWLRDSALASGRGARRCLRPRGRPRASRLGAAAARRRLQRGATAALGGVAFAALSVPGSVLHGALYDARHAGMAPVAHAGYEASLVLLSASAVLIALPTLAGGRRLARGRARVDAAPAPARRPRCVHRRAGGVRGRHRRRPQRRHRGGRHLPDGRAPDHLRGGGLRDRHPAQRLGRLHPDGLVYALRKPEARVGKDQMLADPKLTQPLVIRANVGDCITVKLRNDIAGRRVGMHTDGLLRFDPKDSDGTVIGTNPDTTVATGAEITYTWYADREGEAPLIDAANIDAAIPGAAGPAVEDPNAPHVEDPTRPTSTRPTRSPGTRRCSAASTAR